MNLEHEVARLIKRVDALEAQRPGRKAKPLIALRQDGVCAINPDIDSSTCEDASIFRYQQGCHGTGCKNKQHNAYQRRKDRPAVETPVAKPKRATKTVAKTPPPASVPARTPKPKPKPAMPAKKSRRLTSVG
jgi:hypothetical protein